MRIELTTKPWQGLVLPLAPYPQFIELLYRPIFCLSTHFLVRMARIELARLAASDFESDASTYSATLARNPTSPPSSLIRLITSSNKIGLKSVCSTQTQW